jgi:hypothetical protein
MHSISDANRFGEPRERFAGPFVSLGIVLAFLLLLFFLFPEKRIMDGMANSGDSSTVALGYREAMLRARPADMKLRMEFAEGLVESGQFHKALDVLNECEGFLSAQDRGRYLKTRYRALKGILFAGGAGGSDSKPLSKDFSRVVRELAESGANTRALGRMYWEAKEIGEMETASLLSRKYSVITDTPVGGADGISPGDGSPDYYREQARLAFASMGKAKGIEERRSLFMRGVRFLQSGNLVGEALAAGEAHIHGLESDRQVLLFMTKIALAAGKPAVAERYIRKALRMGPARETAAGG